MGDACSCRTPVGLRAERDHETFVDRALARVAARVAVGDAVRASLATGPFDAPFPVPEYPPADWFDGPPTWVAAYRDEQGLGPDVGTGPDGTPFLKMTITDDGRVGGWFFEHGQCLVHMPDACPGPSPTNYAAFHQNDVVTADGKLLRIGVIGNTHGHASPWVNWREAQKHYADPSAQLIVCRAGDDDRGGWIAGAMIPGTTYADVALCRRSALSGDWRPDFSPAWFQANGATAAALIASDGYDCVGPTLVTRPGLPLTSKVGARSFVLAASVAAPELGHDGTLRAAEAHENAVAGEQVVRVAGVEIRENGMKTSVKLPDGTTISMSGDMLTDGTSTTDTPPDGGVSPLPADPAVTAAVIGAADLPIAPRDAAWDGTAAEGRVRQLASSDSSGDPATVDWESYSRAFFYRDDSQDPKTFGAYKLGFADVVDGRLQAVPAGVFAVAAVLGGARGGADIPASDQDAIKGRVGGYYGRMADQFNDPSIKAPWASDAGSEETTMTAADPTIPTAPAETPPVDAPDAEDTNEAPPTIEELAAEVEALETRLAAVEDFLSQMLESEMTAALAADVELPAVDDEDDTAVEVSTT